LQILYIVSAAFALGVYVIYVKMAKGKMGIASFTDTLLYSI